METPTFSHSDCQKIVSKKLNDDFVIVEVRNSTFDHKNGYLGDHSLLTVTIKRNQCNESHNFFVKTLPTVPSQRQFLLEINGFFKEHRFFTRYLNLLEKHSIKVLEGAIPRCFLVNDETFVFDDLVSKGYKTLPSRVSLDLESVKAALTTFAKLHASCIILEEKKQFWLVDEFEDEVAETFYSDKESVKKAYASSKHGLRALVDLTHTQTMTIPKSMFMEKILDGLDQQKLFAQPSTKFRNTICHGDPWTKNLMFKFDDRDVKCVMVDFQSYRYCPPGQDVMAFLHLTTDKKLRDDHLD
ncbi:uncharacterized protein LOC135137146 [Zophobas morio]|uniref:uncharacterized protein LOC135137146 n=1 Tax=Zophobas morio TaxID=2755281 RepID=UPI003083CCCF